MYKRRSENKKTTLKYNSAILTFFYFFKFIPRNKVEEIIFHLKRTNKTKGIFFVTPMYKIYPSGNIMSSFGISKHLHVFPR